MKHAILLFVLAACPAGPVSKPEPVAGPKECERMADHLATVTAPKDDGKKSDAEIELLDKFTRMLIRECTEMKWSIDAQKCFLSVIDMDDSAKCTPLLTVGQRESADKAIEEVFPKRPPPPGSPNAIP